MMRHTGPLSRDWSDLSVSGHWVAGTILSCIGLVIAVRWSFAIGMLLTLLASGLHGRNDRSLRSPRGAAKEPDDSRTRGEEDRLREAIEFLENIFESSPDSIGVVDREGRLVRWNRTAEERYGYTFKELEGKSIYDLYADPTELEEMLDQLHREGAIKKYAIDMRRKDGSVTPFEISINLLKNGRTETVGSVCVARDLSDIRKALSDLKASNERLQQEIMERKRVEETLRKSEHGFREILENIRLLAISLDAEGRITFCNDFFLALTGWQRNEILERDWFESFHPAGMCTGARQSYTDRIQRGEIEAHCEEEISTYLGRRCLVSWNTTLLRDPDGNVVGTTRIGQDIGMRRKMEKELRDASTEMELLIASIPSVLIELSAEGRIIRWNSSAERTFGLSAEAVMGRVLKECPIRWESERVSANLSDCLATKSAIRIDDIRFTRTDGKEGLVGLTMSPIKGELDELSGLIILGSDVTDRRLLERQLAQAQKLESIGQLAAGIAHEINTPTQYVGDNTRFLLTAFQDIQQMLEKVEAQISMMEAGGETSEIIQALRTAAEEADLGYLKEEIPKAIEQSLEGVERVSKIVRAMKEFSHPGSTEKTAIDINKAIESTITVARNEWKYLAEMIMDFDPSMPLVPCLPGEFNQVILNMIVNAAHALADKTNGGSSPNGTITVTTRNQGDQAQIRISDTGAGIPENIRSRIFDPFFTTKEVGKGTGQGLAIAYSVIVEKHGGSIRFETEEGNGTTFVINVPITELAGLRDAGA
ncbi:MAG: PAS domain S-box protein [Syntrophobacteraceae bacterium]